MKTRKILAVLLAVVVLVGSLAVVSSAAPTFDATLVQTVYKDSEYFKPEGLIVMDGVTPVPYLSNEEDFVFIPALDELLTVETSYVRVIYKNEEIGIIPVTVSHSFGKIEYLSAKDHGARCKGCGIIDVAEAHQAEYAYDVDGNLILDERGNPKEDWIPNDDGGMFVPQTEHATCSVCGGEMKRYIDGSEKFNTIFNFGNITDTELEIVGYLQTILLTLVKALISF